MNRSSIIVTFILMSLLLASCESDELTTPQTNALERKLLLNPPHLEGEQYKSYTLKAKLTNVPVSDLSYYWDLDDGQGFSYSGWIITPTFYQSKVYQVRVKVLDGFTDSLLAFDSIRVDIRPPAKFVEISPKLIDTTLVMNPDGTIAQYLQFNLKASLPNNFIRMEWDYGDGSDIESGSAHKFLKPGTFKVRVKVFETSGAYLGSDSATVIIHMPEFTHADIANATNVSVWFSVDPGHDVVKDPLFANPLGLGISTIQDPGSEIKGLTFDLFLRDSTIVSQDTLLAFPKKLCLDTIAGELSDDLKSIKKVSVSVNDTGRIGGTSNAKLRYSYMLNDLELLAVTNTQIVYRSTSSFMPAFAKDLYFSSSNVRNLPRGTLLVAATPPAPKAGAFGLVIFDK